MALSNEDLLKELSAKPIMEVVDLVKMLEEEWGVSAAAPVAVAAAAGADAAPVEEKTEFDVVLTPCRFSAGRGAENRRPAGRQGLCQGADRAGSRS